MDMICGVADRTYYESNAAVGEFGLCQSPYPLFTLAWPKLATLEFTSVHV